MGSMGKNVVIRAGVSFHRPRNVFIGSNVVISEEVEFGSENASGILKIGDNVQINRGCIIDHSGDTIIGDYTLISEDVCILSHSHGYDPRSQSRGIPKSIGAHCWIGIRVIVGENVHTIADHIIIATGAIVVQSCETPNSIYGGVPAKLIKSIET